MFQLIKKSSFSADPYEDIMMEIEEMKKEKLHNQKKIRDLLDKLDESVRSLYYMKQLKTNNFVHKKTLTIFRGY